MTSRIIIKEVVISSGQSITPEIDLFDTTGELGRLEIIQMPSSWTTADLTFQIGDGSGGVFNNQYDDEGTEATIVAAASRAIDINSDITKGMRFIKIRSGTSGSPVNQAADRTLKLHILFGSK